MNFEHGGVEPTNSEGLMDTRRAAWDKCAHWPNSARAGSVPAHALNLRRKRNEQLSKLAVYNTR